MIKKLLVALSLANLFFFNAWREALSPQAFFYFYYWKQYPGYAILAALVFNVLLLASLFFACFYAARRFVGRRFEKFVRAGFLLVFLLALNGIRAQFDRLSVRGLRISLGKPGLVAICLIMLTLAVFVVARYGLVRMSRAVASMLLVVSPFGLVGMGQAAWIAYKYGVPAERERPQAPALEVGADARPRVLWVIFDEMDERMAFAERPASLSLPEFDRLRSESLFATNAFPPAGHTSQSLPALLTGQLISAVKPVGPDELMLTIPARQATVGWSRQPDIFSDARAAGFNTALAGWYHPYCRVIGDRLTSCRWEPASQLALPDRLSVWKNIVRQQIGLFASIPFAGDLHSRLSRTEVEDYGAAHLADYRALLPEAESVAANREFGLTFVHLPVPHPPYIYERAKGELKDAAGGSYLDNLALADRTLGELRRAMEQAGSWETTTVVVSSDHWMRSDYWRVRPFWTALDSETFDERVEHRVPFIVKLAGQKSGTTYDAPFNTVLTRDLIMEVLGGRIRDPGELAAWLDAHRTFGESPYQSYEDEQ
ncbi:MAG TPA: sulfatase-like hydrolase/transferase [Pyrinomonadaceae bacterium]|nr:sulfatase-like hydrolase/transferase [Pyrinomonadaceae bacterium]